MPSLKPTQSEAAGAAAAPSMTRKHFLFLAEGLRDSPEFTDGQRFLIARWLCGLLRQTNSAFKPESFMSVATGDSPHAN